MNIFFAYIHYLSPKTVRSIIHYIFSPLRRSFFKYFFEKGSNINNFPPKKIIQIQNVPQCSVANNECPILLNIHYLILQTNNLEFFCMQIPLNFSSFFVLKTLKKYNILCGFSQDFYFTLIMAPFNL